MILFTNCKINLGLHVVGKRNDGYHDIESVFYPVPIHDIIEIIADPRAETEVQLVLTGVPIDGSPENNLCVKAYRLLKKDFLQLPPVRMHLHKIAPVGSGLGGGSADGAFMLRLINTKFELGITDQQLMNYALQLGSDCPFFIVNQPSLGTGRGEHLKAVNIDISAYNLLIVNPGLVINTANVFSSLTPSLNYKSIGKIIQQPVDTWRKELLNDLEIPVFINYPAIEEIKEQMYLDGAVYASMSGSGSTVFGLFKRKQNIAKNYPADYLVWELSG